MEEPRIDYKCSTCDLIDHNENHFCNCEDRNIKLGRQYRKDGINLWKKPEMLNLNARDESDFVDLYLNNRRPFTIWVPDDFDYEKMHKIAQENGFVFINTNIDGRSEAICLPKSPSSDQEPDSRTLRIKWPEKESMTQMLLPLLSEEKSTEIKE